MPCIAFSNRLLQNGIWDVKANTLIDVPIGFQRQYRYTSVYSFEWDLRQNHVDPTEAWEKARDKIGEIMNKRGPRINENNGTYQSL